MKELTIKEKAEAYDYAVNKAKELILNENGVVRVDKPLFDELFPSEMEESEDERIRKKLIEAVKRDMVVGGTKDKQLAIAWLEKQGEKEKFIKKELDCIRGYRDEAIRRLNELEKQGEHKHQYKSRPRYVGEEELLGVNKQGEQKPVDVKPHLPDGNIPYDRGFEEAQEYIFHRGFDIPWNDCDVFVDERYITQTVANVLTWADDHPKYGEQKPEWSEEDEKQIRQIERIVKNAGCTPNLQEQIHNWLKSLKDRYTWKPSGEHYELEEFAKIVRSNLTGISKAVQKLFEAKYLQLTGNKMYEGFKD